MSLGTLTLVGLVVLGVLAAVFLKVRQKDLISALMRKRSANSQLVTRADYVEGGATMPVALALTADTFYYESPDMEASFELARIDEVEYDNELVTGKAVEHGRRALRLRSHGTTFEFVLEPMDYPKWSAALPPRRLGDPVRAAV